MVGARAPRTEQIYHRSWPGSGGGSKGFGSGGVGGRGTGPRDGANFATCVVFLCFSRTKEEKWRSFEGCLVGWRGVPTGAGLVDGGVDQGPWLQERVGGGVGAGWQFQRRGRVGCSKEGQVQGRGQGRVGLAVGGGGARASVPGG